MDKEVEIRVAPEELESADQHLNLVSRKLGVSSSRITQIKLKRRSIDARHNKVRFVLRYLVGVDAPLSKPDVVGRSFRPVHNERPVAVVGAGPAGLFAALRLIELGLKPIIIERGKAVRERRKDIANVSKGLSVDPDSNYCFGEGGAGTFSDGKLYTRATKRGDVVRILQTLVDNGAAPDILIDAHPHIGTNKLPAVIESIRRTILEFGGEILFGERVQGFELKAGRLAALSTNSGLRIEGAAVILATGHSARDIFSALRELNITLEAKPFALGVRVEHPQGLIDQVQYGKSPRHHCLPAASYSLKAQADNRGVFSFCMCPGGVICPAATSDGEIVVNGWSPSKRNSHFANSGIVVEVSVDDLLAYGSDKVFAGIELQMANEQRSFRAGGGGLKAPAQRLCDFVEGKVSQSLPRCSYNPGTTSCEIGDVLDVGIVSRLREGFLTFGKDVRGYLTNEAIVVATESRTSSPIKIPRGADSLMHPEVDGLFPCGEGAGYA
ncbi:MAG: FAD-binding protein, partial [Bdellovibrionales bacterium]|nr:FAD-binding protein [Bdellovibrionales bacterium]